MENKFNFQSKRFYNLPNFGGYNQPIRVTKSEVERAFLNGEWVFHWDFKDLWEIHLKDKLGAINYQKGGVMTDWVGTSSVARIGSKWYHSAEHLESYKAIKKYIKENKMITIK